ncbi:MAG: hypothetical protein HC831_07120 [Chloroflexia bacterium]|nr:hypothetical protein [Chloroflexia bacterium]
MGKLISILVTLVLGTLFLYTCEVPRSFPDTPEIEFKSLLIENGEDILGNKVKLVVLTVNVKDGDGDIGIQYSNGSYFQYSASSNDTANFIH